ncbi:RNA-guided endonuclease InsQ/TnpB family protein [Alkalimarinus coralli]|uniref:RNA-guided endonuclease InsQ/TnpB family protein n=1 Tax=Alkalimarinus coralli TaxID=2935863 RepID=UPI00202ADD2D|nr:transposase [Alkalimarinus coralli]
MKKTKTLRVRVRDNHAYLLGQMARQVNYVWNFLNELSLRSVKERGVFMSAYDLQKYTDGAGKLLGLHSHTVQEIGKEYVTRRKQFKKAKLNWRKSGGVRRSLGWIPIKTGASKWKNGQVFHNGHHFKIWDSYDLSKYKFRSASFSEDARGRWYFNVVVDVEAEQSTGTQAVGIDLGCKEAATSSHGDKLLGRNYRTLEAKLGLAQRARNKKRVKAIHAKIVNRRKDGIHKYTSKLVQENAAVFVGNVSSKGLAKTKLAKSVLDAGWGMMKTILEYKCDHAGIVFDEVNEAYTTQACSCCAVIPDSSPKGRTGLGIREWTCSACNTTHDRDINAAKNILAVGLHRLAEGKVATTP